MWFTTRAHVLRSQSASSAEHLWAMGHAWRQASRHWEYAQDDTIYGVPREEILDDGYHAHLAKMIRKGRPKVDLTEHIQLAGDASAGSDFLSALGGGEVSLVWVIRTANTLRCVIGNTIVLKNGKSVLSAGSLGNVHCTVPQVLTYALDFKLDPYAAVDAPRMLPMKEARSITIEDRLAPGVVADLHKLGVRVAVVAGYDYHMGSFSVIARHESSGRYTAIADPRRCAVADGIR